MCCGNDPDVFPRNDPLYTQTQQIPSVTLKATDLSDVSTDDLFAGKKVVLFGVPGAFTPTCSKTHLPGFVSAAADLKAKGVDLIACVSVNDAFVMKAWGESAGVGSDVLLLADGNGDLAKAMDLELDGRGFGLGTRCKRFAAVIDNGVVKALNVEPGGGLTCSAAADVLGML